MQLYRDHLPTRIGGTVLGALFILVGCYALLGGSEAITAIERERVVAFGITALIGGLFAIAASWLEPRLNEVWCAHPRRWRRSRSSRP